MARKKKTGGVVRPVDEVTASELVDTVQASEEEDSSLEMRQIREMFNAPKHAKYKIEVWVGSKRTSNNLNARIDFWLSASQMDGNGDDHMFICGYPDCQKPFSPNYVQGNWSVCPHCARKKINNGGVQSSSLVESLGYRLDPKGQSLRPVDRTKYITVQGIRYPGIHDCVFVSGSPLMVAEILKKSWDALEGDAEFTVKFNPLDIRGIPVEELQGYDPRDRVVVYKLENIIKDTSGGADLTGRLKALLST